MVDPKVSWDYALYLPELFSAIAQFLDCKSLCTLRLFNKAFSHLCMPYFSAALVFSELSPYPDYKRLLDATLGDSSDKATLPRLDLIRSLRLAPRPTSTTLTPLLNLCHNLRHIEIEDNYWRNTRFELKPFYPARKVWPSNLLPCQAHDDFVDSRWAPPCPDIEIGPYPDDGALWNLYDLLSLEGSLLDRLETLKVDAGEESPLSINRFMFRLGQSSAAKTLRFLTILKFSQRGAYSVGWKIFRECICSLTVLESLTFKNYEILDIDDETNYGYESAQSSVSGGMNNDPRFESQQEDPPAIPFPRLKILNIPFGNAEMWAWSQLVRTWAQRQPRLHFPWAHIRGENLQESEALLKTLEDRTLSFATLDIYEKDPLFIRKVLSSRVFAKMDLLRIINPNLDIVEVLRPLFDPSGPELISQRNFSHRLPWLRTVTVLSFRSSSDSPLDSTRGKNWEQDLSTVRILLQQMPQLIDLTLVTPISDLALFEGLGRGLDDDDFVNSTLAHPFEGAIGELLCNGASVAPTLDDRTILQGDAYKKTRTLVRSVTSQV
ncbi:hypothetical protein EMPS_00793 [Entomortierella parvispora]|uniref:F-box domain-containing protein n=1 Tax=Entomortierella parvispora TaxID=205924 RepID=A0A9P3H2D3_9FUNG|nr:hypothetical protein EMPS_00793 [Entomortierella parvispora]